MELQNIKALLPDGSYTRIAEKVGCSAGTVSQFFAENVRVRISEKKIEAITKEALTIIEEQKEKAVRVLDAHQKLMAA